MNSAYQFELDGVTYAIPFDVADLEANGWHFSSDSYYDYKLAGLSTIYMKFVNDKDSKAGIEMLLLNGSGNAQQAKDCRVSGVRVDGYTPGINFKTTEGITLGSTRAEVENVYGENDDKDYLYYNLYKSLPDYETSWNLSVFSKEANSDQTNINYKDGIVSTMSMAYYKMFDSDITEVSKERPSYLDELYQEPTEILQDDAALTYELDGVYYALPTPVSVLTENGWTVEDCSIPSFQDKSYINMTKGEDTIRVSVQNDSDFLQDISDCYVYNIIVSSKNYSASFETKNGISHTMTEEDFLAGHPQFDEIELDGKSGTAKIDEIDYYKYISDSYHTYKIGLYAPCIVVDFNEDDLTITVTADKWYTINE